MMDRRELVMCSSAMGNLAWYLDNEDHGYSDDFADECREVVEMARSWILEVLIRDEHLQYEEGW
jgi:hypothetical protein